MQLATVDYVVFWPAAPSLCAMGLLFACCRATAAIWPVPLGVPADSVLEAGFVVVIVFFNMVGG
jgi:hypothetical protein